jgi:poly(3-hydroxyalkanoate) synthetase
VSRETTSTSNFPPVLAGHVAESAFEAWSATMTGIAEFWAGALGRGATPLDVTADGVDWLHAMTSRSKPTWSSPNEVLLDGGFAALRDFTDGSRSRVVPTLVLPPQAGHHSCIVDYSRDQSQMATIKAAGLERAYALEWIGANDATKDTRVEDYIDFIERSIELIGGPVNLIGDCQGGWLAAIYAALHPDHVNTLTLAGAPIDFHAGEGVIAEWVRALCTTGDTSFYEALVDNADGVMPGKHILDGFVLIKPESEIGKQLGLLASIGDPKHRERYRDFEDWFKWTQDLPGEFYLWVVRELFRDNKLIDGELVVGGQKVDLSKLEMPLYLLAGETDHITPPPQVFAAADAVSTPAADVTKRTTSGGHLGLFMGREALREHWPPTRASARRGRGPSAARGRARPRGAARSRRPSPRRRTSAGGGAASAAPTGPRTPRTPGSAPAAGGASARRRHGWRRSCRARPPPRRATCRPARRACRRRSRGTSRSRPAPAPTGRAGHARSAKGTGSRCPPSGRTRASTSRSALAAGG